MIIISNLEKSKDLKANGERRRRGEIICVSKRDILKKTLVNSAFAIFVEDVIDEGLNIQVYRLKCKWVLWEKYQKGFLIQPQHHQIL